MKKICFLLCVLLAAVTLAIPIRLLILTDESERAVFAKAVKLGERCTVRFIHSVARRPVDEVYEVARDCLVLQETWFDMGGAGLPLDLPDPKLAFSLENGKYHITGYNMRLPNLTYRINKVVADHALIFGARETKLKELVGPGRALTFRVRKRPAGWLLWFKTRNLMMKNKEAQQNGRDEKPF